MKHNKGQMITSLNEFKKSRGIKNTVLESMGIEEDNFDFVPAPAELENELENELDTDGVVEDEAITFDQFKEAVVAEHERLTSEMEEGEECCELPTDEQLELLFTVHQNLCAEAPVEDETEIENDEEPFDEEEIIEETVTTEEPTNEIFGKKDKGDAYKNTIEFVEGDSEEAKKITELYDKYLKGKDDNEIRKSPQLLKVMQHITALGAKWAKANKMEPKDYSFKQIKTVIEKDFDRKFTGGVNVAVGESKKSTTKKK
jgi:peptide methionine sulfoxide reductase MsrA